MLACSLLLSELSGVLFSHPNNTWVSFSGFSALSSEFSFGSVLVPVPYGTSLVIPITRHKIAGLRF